MDKLKMHSPDLSQDNIAKLRELFPGCVTEARDEATGQLRLAVDFDQLKQELSDHSVGGPQERYRLDWPGKREALAAANAPIAKTLRLDEGESVSFHSTENLFIEGDNLEALKILQEPFLGEVQLIFIDPPYNTGNDFVYDDDFSESAEEFFIKSLQADDIGNRMVANLESNGRFHSDWLSMIYSRLRVARNLLSKTGFICISIDDGESANLKKVMDEIFGEENFVATLAWQKRYVANVTARHISDMHDFIHVYSKSAADAKVQKWPLTEEQLQAYKNPDNDPRGRWRAQDLSASKPYQAGLFTIYRNGQEFRPPPNRYWRCNEAQFNAWVREGRIWWGIDGSARPMLKSYLEEKEATTTPHTWWDYEKAGHNKEATLEMKELFDGASPFDTPKPVRLMRRLLETFGNGGLVMDFFAGSSSFAHAVLESNAEKNLGFKFIQVQWPEKLKRQNDLAGTTFTNIAQISRERIRRAGKKILEGECHPNWNRDVGFRVLKVDTSNMKDVYYRPDEVNQADLLDMVDNVKEDRTDEDLLFQVLVDWGVDLTLPIRRETITLKDEGGRMRDEGRADSSFSPQPSSFTVFFVDDNALVACFERGVTEELVKELAGHEPLRVVFRDNGFVSDAVKINVEQIFRQLSPVTEVKSL
ncbi:MAG: site-specific DNA-methyltransferase [Lamprobacter sp.]|uniref:site-specific DNA-methyltransferase n=1 Tax=Lamprobacter sp. TaxID=3100796 RepID=UPI002B25EDCE|nr:site-specific DNA-methyltransferase [Lamprobacter sp.]MEA3640006.1 site-specific DNA-methyltransferase [Lamprobacter sp.]